MILRLWLLFLTISILNSMELKKLRDHKKINYNEAALALTDKQLENHFPKLGPAIRKKISIESRLARATNQNAPDKFFHAALTMSQSQLKFIDPEVSQVGTHSN